MRSIFSVRIGGIVAALTLTVLMAGVGPVAAQEGPTSDNTTVDVQVSDGGGEECTEHIDEVVSVCSRTYENGDAILELQSERITRVTLTDAGAFVEGGQINRQQTTLREGRNTIRFRATEVQGFVGVAVDTGRVLYAVKIEELSDSGPPIGYETAQASIAITAIGAGAFTFRVVRKRRDDEKKEVERIL